VPVLGFFFREYNRYFPDFNRRIIRAACLRILPRSGAGYAVLESRPPVNHTLARSVLALLAAAPALAQEPAPVYQTDKRTISLKADVLLRQEWTRHLAVAADTFEDDDRWRGQLRPRLEIDLGKIFLGVGGDFNYSSDENTKDISPTFPIVRDNYKSRDARLDLAFARLQPAGWLRLEGGRFPMPVALTEMIWDRDLRPQGGALTLDFRNHGGFEAIGITVLGARSSHVFDDDDTSMLLASLGATLPAGQQTKLELLGSYVAFSDVDKLEPILRRQNLRVAGAPAPPPLGLDYKVVDLVARLRYGGKTPTMLVAEYCWNTEADDLNKGLWAAVVIGSTETSSARFEYTYASVDRDATLAAYGADDFLWVTGWDGHRLDLGFRTGEHASVHAVGQLQRFKDSPRGFDNDVWVRRYRLELRIHR
jgi:putative porin